MIERLFKIIIVAGIAAPFVIGFINVLIHSWPKG